METTRLQPRQIAYIVKIKDVLNAQFIKEDNLNPSYVKINDKNVSRINIIGVIIDNKQENNIQSIIVDDSTGKISLRNFEKKIDVSIGDIVLIIGRIRQFGNEKYVTPEIIRKINPKWNLVWKKIALVMDVQEPVKEEKIGFEIDESSNLREKLISKIKDLDDGTGASYEEISKIVDEKIISNFLMQGDIFEIKPGRLKVLD